MRFSSRRNITAAGAFLVSLDSAVNVALPAIAESFGLPAESMRWIIVCYVLTYSITSFIGGAAADRLGHGVVFRTGIACCALGYALVAVASSFGMALVGRVVQGVAAGLVYGTAPALVTAATPGGRGRAIGFLAAAMGSAFAVGPLVAGPLVDGWGWRAVFLFRIPLAVIVLAWAVVSLPVKHAVVATSHRLAADVLRPPVLVAGLLGFLSSAGIFAIWLLAPFHLVSRRGLAATTSGLLFMLTPLGTAVAAPLAGRAADRFGHALPTVLGLVIEAVGLAVLASSGPATPLMAVALALFAAGFGLGFFQVPNLAAVLAAFPLERQGVAGGFAFLARTLGVVTGVLGFAALFAARRLRVGFDVAFGEAMLAAAIAVALAAALALLSALRRGARA